MHCPSYDHGRYLEEQQREYLKYLQILQEYEELSKAAFDANDRALLFATQHRLADKVKLHQAAEEILAQGEE